MDVLLNDFVVRIDRQDAHLLQEHGWSVRRAKKTFYVYRILSTAGNMTTEYLHRRILSVVDRRQVDHRDRDGLNNRRVNLRIATPSQQGANSCGRRAGFKGVFFDDSTSQRRPWRARIKVNGIKHNLGRYETEASAAEAYDEAALDYFGEFARINFGAEAR
jgi:hypothetical protein